LDAERLQSNPHKPRSLEILDLASLAKYLARRYW
jgi:hypothetical protein